MLVRLLLIVLLCAGAAYADSWGTGKFAGPYIEETYSLPEAGLRYYGDAEHVLIDTSSGGITASQQINQAPAGGAEYTQATKANQPTVVRNVLNGHNALRFDGNDILLGNTAAQAIANNISSMTVCGVWAAANGAQQYLFNAGSGTLNSATRFGLYKSSGNYTTLGGRRLDADSFAFIADASTTGTEPVISCASVNWSTRVVTLYKNGTQVATSSTFQTSGSTSATNSLVSAIGGLNSSNQMLVGDEFEVAVWAPELSSSQITEYTRSRGWKYWIAVP